MALTSDDLVNLECALTARRHNPVLRVVMRIFDPRLAERLDRGIELDLTRSVSALAAPAFSAALLGRVSAQPLALSNVPLRVLETRIPEGRRAPALKSVTGGVNKVPVRKFFDPTRHV